MFDLKVGFGAVAVMMAGQAGFADVGVAIRDGNPLDEVRIVNLGACDIAAGGLTVDFHGSAGGVLIDTVRGGPGTKDPFPVAIQRGALALGPVQDGDRVLRVAVLALAPRETAVVTLDLDDTASWQRGDRVTAEGAEIAGTRVVFELDGYQAEAVLGDAGTARIAWPGGQAPCAPEPELEEAPLDTLPMG